MLVKRVNDEHQQKEEFKQELMKTKKTNKVIKKKRAEAEIELERMEQRLRESGLQVQNKLKDEVRGAELNDRDRRLRDQENSIKA